MKKIQLLLLLSLSLLSAVAQTVENNNLVIGKVDSIHSKYLNASRKIWIYLPASARKVPDRKQHYPIIYLLDAESHFTSLTGMVQQFSEVNGNKVFPEAIVVGIPNVNRSLDLTPTNALTGPNGRTYPSFKNSGGGEKFVAFIEKELMPHIDSLYAPSAHQTIIGHSFGGLTVMNIMVHHPNLFNRYVAIDPSMWWDSRRLLNETKAALKNKGFKGKHLFVGVANTMPPGMTTTQAVTDTSGTTGHIRAILSLNEALQNRPSNGLMYEYKFYQDDDHGSVPLIAEYDALHWIFKEWKKAN